MPKPARRSGGSTARPRSSVRCCPAAEADIRRLDARAGRRGVDAEIIGIGALERVNVVFLQPLDRIGIAGDVPLTALVGAPRLVWTGFIINAATGIALFTTDAEHKATQTVFFVKLSLIFLALAVYGRIRKLVFRTSSPTAARISGEVKALAVLSLLLWTGATVAGRLMAYLL